MVVFLYKFQLYILGVILMAVSPSAGLFILRVVSSCSVSVCFKWDRAVTSMLAGCFDFLQQVLFI